MCTDRALSATEQVGCYGSLMLLAGHHCGHSGACLSMLLPSLGTGKQACHLGGLVSKPKVCLCSQGLAQLGCHRHC